MKALLFKMIRFTGLTYLFRELIQKNKTTILMFHDISQETADKTFAYLSRKYNIIDLNDFITACETKNSENLPDKALILTFDDGHMGNYNILPIIKKFNVPVTIFLCAGIINTNRHFWFKHNLPDISPDELKNKSNKEKLEILSKAGFYQDKNFDTPQALSEKQINEMKSYVNFQSHTLFHPCLPNCDYDEARHEIFNSKKNLENIFNLNINTIAYPNGDYSPREIKLSKEAGYKCGITINFGYNTIKTDMFKLNRLSVNDTDNIDELIVKSSGVWAFIKTKILMSDQTKY